MYRTQLFVLIVLCFLATSALAIREDNSSGLLQMDTNMSELMSLPQPDSSLRFLQTLTNQQQDIQNLNLNLQKNEQESKVQITRLEHRIDFINLLLWCLIAMNAVLVIILMIMAIRIRSLSKKINQPMIEPLETSEPIAPSTLERIPASSTQSIQLKKSPQSEDDELEELLSSVKDDDIAALFSDDPDQNFFQHFQNEIDRERSQFKKSPSKHSDENDALDKLLDEQFTETDFSTIAKEEKPNKINF
ncbi:conserved hypothetical protein, membrane [Candidatus Magnetomorum sp. HK-1]|nr:conserved hypothetical protein, membrane [Candidatus Magnetomorum sp. HK-1]